MPTIDEYCDAAIARHPELHSDRDLSRALGLSTSSVSQYRTKRAWPNETTMLAIAEMAAMDPDQAIIDLGSWRANTPGVRAVWERISEKLAKAGAIVIFLLLAIPQGHAREVQNVNSSTSQISNLYIMRF